MDSKVILVIDDNALNLKLTRLVLTRAGYDIHTAQDATEAITVLKHLRPALILMDVQLPGMDGLELTRHLKSSPETRDLKIVALTAQVMKGDAERARDAGCDGYITKPIDTRTFAEQVQQFL